MPDDLDELEMRSEPEPGSGVEGIGAAPPRTGGDRLFPVLLAGAAPDAAVLASICAEVYSIEILEVLGKVADGRLKGLGYTNIHLRVGDGYRGWPEVAPFDAIIVTAAPPEIPKALLDQLKVGGRLIVPVGTGEQTLVRIRRTKDGYSRQNLLPVRFVPMVSEEAAAAVK